MGDGAGWDLRAVVRGCGGTTSAADPFCSFSPVFSPDGWGEQDELFSCFPDLFTRAETTHELDELWRPFISDPQGPHAEYQQPPPLPSPSPPLFISPRDRSATTHSAAPQPPASGDGAAPALPPQQAAGRPHHRAASQSSKSKRRKNQQKREVQVAADGLSSDVWAWRKYGQKPIKGSPYPRGYYRCSSSKGCLARKHVERSRTDPAMFLVTYTGEHNHAVPTHRNSLAGSTRQKFPPSGAAAPSPAGKSSREARTPGADGGTSRGLAEQGRCKAPPRSPSPSSSPAGSLTPTGDSAEEEPHPLPQLPAAAESGEDLLLLHDMEMLGEDDVLFLDLESLLEPGAAGADPFPDHFGLPGPWMAGNTVAAAGGR